MREYLTTVKALCRKTGKLKVFVGPVIKANSFEEARKYCDENDLSFLNIDVDITGVQEACKKPDNHNKE